MTDFLAELELQMTAAAHRAAAERARPPRVRRWPTVAFVAVAAVAIAVMFLLPERRAAGARSGQAGVRLAQGHPRHGLQRRGGRGPRGLRELRPAQARSERDHGHAVVAPHARPSSATPAIPPRRGGSPSCSGSAGPSCPPICPALGPPNVVVFLGQDFAPPAKRLLDSFALLREATNRTVETPAGPVRVHATGAGLCLQVREGLGWGGTCVDVTDAVTGRTVFSLRARDGRLRGAVGLVPDGIDAVELGHAGGTSRRLPVGRNLWAVGAEHVSTVSFGGRTITVP